MAYSLYKYGETPPTTQTQDKMPQIEGNTYLVPEEVYTAPNWGQQTAAKLDEYLQNYHLAKFLL